ncbi:hypothetical protein ACXM2N_10285 [Corynebacterium sp. ZY180755]
MNIDLAVVAEQLTNFKTLVGNVTTVFQEFPKVIQDLGLAFTSSEGTEGLDLPPKKEA